jgi:glycosyltransferase involved in cell wall biosynthesis
MTLCLCMIVCNEAHVIGRALKSVRGIIDYWVICDTGSTDSTPAEILKALVGIPGELHRVPWVDFGHNRSDVLRRARGKADYILIMDADMIAHVHAPFKHLLDADFYELRYTGDVDYSQRMLISNRHEWTYFGVTHEYVNSPTAAVEGVLWELQLEHVGDGGMRFDKFERDAKLLTAALAQDPDNSRNVFYLAQTYRDLGRYADALECYEKRATLGGWEEEAWYALLQVAHMQRNLNRDWNDVQTAFLRAYARRPTRLEPLYEIVKYYRERGEYALGYTFAAQAGHGICYPDDRLFIEKPVYYYLFLLEYATCAYGHGRISEAIEAFNLILRLEDLPKWVSESAVRGREMAVKDLYPKFTNPPETRNRIVVVAPFYNAGAYLEKCVRSLLEQDYPDFRVLFLDDASTGEYTHVLPAGDSRFTSLRNYVRRGLAPNLLSLLTEQCEPDDIVVCLDGDDWLAAPDALSHVNQCYNQYDCWVLYGQFQFENGDHGFSQPFASTRDFMSVRGFFRTSHLRTFRAGLFHRIADVDQGYSCLKNNAGQWLESAVDAALMCPLVEMAGYDRVRFNPRVLYVYNDENPLNLHRLDRSRQMENYELVRRKRPFARIDSYLPQAPRVNTFSPIQPDLPQFERGSDVRAE